MHPYPSLSTIYHTLTRAGQGLQLAAKGERAFAASDVGSSPVHGPRSTVHAKSGVGGVRYSKNEWQGPSIDKETRCSLSWSGYVTQADRMLVRYVP